MARTKANRHCISSDQVKNADAVRENYSGETGVFTLTVDSDGEIVGDADKNWVCGRYYCGNREKCLRDHQRVLDESFRLGSLFVHLCHKDFVLWGVPITKNNAMVGGILGGFLLFEQYRPQLPKYRDEFPIADSKNILISSEKVRTYSESLFERVKRENLFDLDLFEILEKRAQIQTDIAEKIIEKKVKGESDDNLIYQKQDKLLKSIKLCEIDRIRSNFHEVLSEIFIEAINSIDLLKFRMLELFVLISRTLLEIGGDINEFYHLTNQYSKNTEDLKDIYSFSLWLTDVLNDFIDTVITKRRKLGNINRAVEYITQNLDRKLTVSKISSVAAMSKSRFSTTFHKEMGVPFSEYVNQARIEKAKELINQKRLTLTEIAMDLNFHDQSHFIRTFKKFVGQTPGQYAKNDTRNDQIDI
ncbi:MAG: helix-turn-helix domain-containing protein [Proteobacteria bacterium]|nr:helix-turn-helix domain-containing protein [Pseudomonadota bacterium]